MVRPKPDQRDRLCRLWIILVFLHISFEYSVGRVGVGVWGVVRNGKEGRGVRIHPANSSISRLGFRMYSSYYNILVVHFKFSEFHSSNSCSVFFCSNGCQHVGDNQSTCNYARKQSNKGFRYCKY